MDKEPIEDINGAFFYDKDDIKDQLYRTEKIIDEYNEEIIILNIKQYMLNKFLKLNSERREKSELKCRPDDHVYIKALDEVASDLELNIIECQEKTKHFLRMKVEAENRLMQGQIILQILEISKQYSKNYHKGVDNNENK